MNLPELESILSRHQLAGRMPSLAGMRLALDRLAFWRWPFIRNLRSRQIVLVAGTNGKGSTIATLDHLLRAAGERTGLFTSPHLVSLTERFQIEGREVRAEQLGRAFEFVYPKVADLNLTRFEILTLLSLDLFASGREIPPVERMLMEVGVGGRYDATNALPHDFCVITKLGLDHQKILGRTLPEIAMNKFGIVSEGSTVVHATLPSEVKELAAQITNQTRSRWIESKTGQLLVERGRSPRFVLKCQWGESELRLPGQRGAENTMLALTAFAELGYRPRNYMAALSSLCWPGRMEKVADDPCPIYLSGDHNEQGIESLCNLLSAYDYRKLHLLVGLGSEKEADPVLGRLTRISESFLYLTETPFKGRNLGEYGKWQSLAKASDANPERALRLIQEQAHPEDLIVVTGSLYLAGELRASLVKTGGP